jgi:hypothetical protein
MISKTVVPGVPFSIRLLCFSRHDMSRFMCSEKVLTDWPVTPFHARHSNFRISPRYRIRMTLLGSPLQVDPGLR